MSIKDKLGVPFTTNIKYISNVITDEDNDKFPVYNYKKVSENHIKYYDYAFSKLVNLGKCARNLLDFLSFEMNNEGIVYNDAIVKRKFKRMVKDISLGKTNYSDATLNVAFSELKKAELLIPKYKGAYKINPEYIYKNSDIKRHYSIEMELKDKYSLDDADRPI